MVILTRKEKLVILSISSPENLKALASVKSDHLKFVNPVSNIKNYEEVPVFIQLGYNVHGNEPSGGEAALLTAYTLVASNNSEVLNYLSNCSKINSTFVFKNHKWLQIYNYKRSTSNSYPI